MSTAAAAAAMGRRRAEALMTSTLRYFDVGDPVTAPDGTVTRAEQNPVRCPGRVRPASMRDFPTEVVGEEVFASNYVVAVSFGQVPVPQVKQHVVVEASPDPALVGVELQIRQVSLGDDLTARRMLGYKVS